MSRSNRVDFFFNSFESALNAVESLFRDVFRFKGFVTP